MKTYNFIVTSPSGKQAIFSAETFYHAIQKMVEKEGYKYSNVEYKAKRQTAPRKKKK
jgi:hypothetical protein